ncbi:MULTISPECIES: twin-arginine translocase TatA/TatE family subunit [Pseudomonas]|uniref:Sec-independent protein translocase protein TatA n=1 Tax=Pseudomonas panipatensis TaxID=428992 RepID=A0A1G8KSU9_9PSED|nr:MULTISPECIES: twin-arginine translocase TatA/TatE family subunit [Pseudomonas]SDI46413.1 sec-independent protein translocase protein TatA [Pseudomonas panipatensis]SMP70542.1 sec-independent protein translocase protein TatA [Pseudomonas panipatensis]
MGMLDWKHWMVLLLVVLVLFGGKRLRYIGSDLGEAIKGFRKSIADQSEDPVGESKRAGGPERPH